MMVVWMGLTLVAMMVVGTVGLMAVMMAATMVG